MGTIIRNDVIIIILLMAVVFGIITTHPAP